MPRTKKPAGTAADPRNGRRLELARVPASTGLEWFVLPARSPDWLPETRAFLEVFRVDPVTVLVTPVDGPVVLRLLDQMDRAVRALKRADRKPVVYGSTGQPVEHPSYGTAARALAEVRACEQQLGIGALNRAKLGVESSHAQASLMDLDARLREARAGSRRRDPRAS